MTAWLDKIKTILRHLSWYDWAAIVIVVAAAVLRLYNLEDSQQFLGDQGRDSMVVSKIFKEADLVFIGPVTSVGNMYLGPLYYYFMVPFLWLSYPSPMGPIYAMAILGTITVALTYVVGKRMFGQRAGLIAAAFFAFSSVAITHTRFSWNPNPAPLPSLLMVYFTYLAWKKNPKYWILVGLMFAILIQLHYVALITAGGAGIIWLISIAEKYRAGKSLRLQLLSTLGAAGVVLLSMTPLILFDLKHNGLNARAFTNIFTSENAFRAKDSSASISLLGKLLKNFEGRAQLAWLTVYFGNTPLVKSFLAISSGAVAWWLWSTRKKKPHAGIVLLSYLAATIVGISLYNHDVYDHYITFIFPVVFLLYGAILSYILKLNRYIGLALTIFIFAAFLTYNFSRMPYHDAGWKISDIQHTAEQIHEKVIPGEKYNIVLFSHSGDIDGQNYRYFLSTMENPPVSDAERDQTETLFIINEEKKLERVVDSPVYEIVVIPDKEPVEVFSIPDGPEITIISKTRNQGE